MSFKFIRSTSGIQHPCPEGAVVTIGNFDGVHLGHAEMVKLAINKAQQEDLVSVVYTFSPHPKELFRPEERHHRVMRVDDKARKLRDMGLDILYVQKFNRDFAGLSAESFVEDVLLNHLNAKHLIVGADFAFGKNRSGNVNVMREIASKHGVHVTVIDDVDVNEERVSSTNVRAHLEAGEVEEAAALLGAPWRVRTSLYEDESLVLRGKLNRYLPIKNAVYWVQMHYTYAGKQRSETLPLAVTHNEVKIHPIGQIPDIPEGRVLVDFLRLEKALNV